MKALVQILLLIFLLAGAMLVNQWQPLPQGLGHRYLPSVKVLKGVSLGHQHTISDYFFLMRFSILASEV
jgi:hypothetical protein